MAFKTLTSNLSLRHLRAFMAVAQESSMTRAATRLHLTPSALSMLVRSMEDDLGIRMFDRTTRRLVLTEAGQQLFPVVKQVFDDLEQGISSLQQAQALKSSHLTLATSPLLASALMPQVIASFRQQHPLVRVNLIDGAVESLPTLVRDGSADLAICTANSDAADLHAKQLYVDKLMLVCQPSHPLAQRREVEWQELAEEPLILLRHGSGLRVLVDTALARWSRKIVPAYEVSQVATALGLVGAGEGISVLPSYAITRAQDASQAPRLATVALVAPVVSREIVALSRTATDMSGVASSLVSHFRKLAGKHQGG